MAGRGDTTSMGTRIEFRLLGPVEVRCDGVRADIGHTRQRAVLAVLLCEANRVVPADVMIDRVWGEDPPAAARDTMYGYVSLLRRAFERCGAGAVLPRIRGGYVARVEPDRVDVARFRRLAGAASAAGGRERAGLLRTALALWHGPALADVDSPWLARVRDRLEEERRQARHAHEEVELSLGRHAALVAELAGAVEDDPYDEPSAGNLMLALYRSGRRADALLCYEQTRARLAEDLGTGPSAPLRALRERIGRDDPALMVHGPASGAPAVVPRELPHDVVDFHGREKELASLQAIAAGAAVTRDGGGAAGAGKTEGPGGAAGRAVVISAIDGMAGVGKTALAIRFGHMVAARFPDGQLYANLRGFDPRGKPAAPADVLARFLFALGVDATRLPAGVEELATLYRSVLAGRRVLVLLDNAVDAAQVRPLLPGSTGCLTLVTSRNRLDGLMVRDGARRVSLDVLRPPDAVAVLRSILGPRQVAGSAGECADSAAAEMARLCGYLPLALRIAAQRAATHPHVGLAELVDELSCEHGRLDLLSDGDDEMAAVRAVFSWSYRALDAPAARLFRLLGLHPGGTLSTAAAAALAGGDVSGGAVAGQLETLGRAHLIDEIGPGRYRLHDLLHVYAWERANAEEPPAGRDAAVRALLDWYLAATAGAVHAINPRSKPGRPRPGRAAVRPVVFADHVAGLDWLETECVNLTSAIQQAAELTSPVAWQLVSALRSFFRLRSQGEAWPAAAGAALRAAERAGDDRACAAMHLSLADIHQNLGNDRLALSHDTEALAISRRIGWTDGQATALGGLGRLRWGLGHLGESLDDLQQALDIYQTMGDPIGEAACLGSLGRANHDLGRLDRALADYARSLRISRRTRSRLGEALALFYLGAVNGDLGRYPNAVRLCQRALLLSEQIHFSHGMALSASYLCRLLAEQHDTDRARHYVEEASSLIAAVGDRRVEAECLNHVADGLLHTAGPAAAAGNYIRALHIARCTGYRRGELHALIGLADAARRRREFADARVYRDQAGQVARTGGYRLFSPRLAALRD